MANKKSKMTMKHYIIQGIGLAIGMVIVAIVLGYLGIQKPISARIKPFLEEEWKRS